LLHLTSTQSVGSKHGLTSQFFVSLQLSNAADAERDAATAFIRRERWQPHCDDTSADVMDLRQSKPRERPDARTAKISQRCCGRTCTLANRAVR
jgi:hypothetical protein